MTKTRAHPRPFPMRSAIPLLGVLAIAATIALIRPAWATSGTMVVTEDTVLTADHFGIIQIFTPGVTLDCNGHRVFGLSGRQGIEAGADDVTIRDCRVIGALNGIAVTRAAKDVHIVGNAISGNANAGITVDPGVAPVIEGNDSSDNGGNGIQLVSTPGAIVRDNTLTGNHGTAGIATGSAVAPLITDNVILGNDHDGINLISSTSATVKHNVIDGNLDGIVVNFGADHAILWNRVRDSRATGLVISATEGARIRGNWVRRSSAQGIWVAQTNHSRLKRNRVVGNDGDGIELSGALGNLVARNSIERNARGILVSSDSLRNLFRDNVLCDNRIAPIVDLAPGANTYARTTLC